MVKFGRNYVLSIETTNDETLTIEPPFTMEFDLTRNTLTSANVGSIRIYNLSQKNRSLIRRNVTDTSDIRLVQLAAGYGNNLPVIFRGNITQAWSVREGENFITQIESLDGGFAFSYGNTNTTFPAGTSMQVIIRSLIGTLPGVTVGAIGEYPGSLLRANSYSGNTTTLLKDITGGGLFIDNGRGNCLGDNECVSGGLPIINSQSGLLGTPLREQTIISFDMLFEPRLLVGQRVQLDSLEGTSRGANFNGLYKVISLKHRGTISAGVCGDAITSVGMADVAGALKLVI